MTAHAPSARLLVVYDDIVEALTQSIEYFEDRADVVDGPNGQPAPNREMVLAQLCWAVMHQIPAREEW